MTYNEKRAQGGQNKYMNLIPLSMTVSIIFLITSGCISEREEPETYDNETENLSYEGKSLTPIAQQRNNAIKGTQYIDRESYRLQVNGLVEKPLKTGVFLFSS